MLKEILARQAAGTQQRTLCLLVLSSASLEVGWLQALVDKGVKLEDAHWIKPHEMRVWQKAHRRPEPQKIDFSKHDVFIVTAHDLQTRDHWSTKQSWHTIIADESHEFLRGQKSGDTSLTLLNWYKLQGCTQSMFLLSGTPYTTNIKHDVWKILRAIAREHVRQSWGDVYTESGFKALLDPWDDKFETRTFKGKATADEYKAEHKALGQEIARVCSVYTLSRDERSLIRGKSVVRDFLGECVCFEEPLPVNNYEEEHRRVDNTLRAKWGESCVLNNRYNEWMRCMC